MTDRITRLAIASGGLFDEDELILVGSDIETFARLIIRECINIIEPDDHPVDEINYRLAIIANVNKHFGVEE